jgi:hypothetical protein
MELLKAAVAAEKEDCNMSNNRITKVAIVGVRTHYHLTLSSKSTQADQKPILARLQGT